MRPAAEKLSAELESVSIQTPNIPVIHNTSVTSTSDPDQIRQLLAQQLYNPVRWVETVEWFAAQGVEILVECGPGKVLAGLTKRIDKTLQALPVFDSATLQKTQEVLGEPS
jgi:[acyl-carrier-protein] S-malonyltransferase